MSQPPSHPWRQPSELDDLFLYQLACLSRTAGTMVVRLCEGGFGITRREWAMISLLAAKGPLQPSQLAEQVRLDRTRTSRTISALIAKELVQKRAIAGDGRHALVQLTASGQALYEELFPKVQLINQQLLDDVSEAQLQTLSQVFAKIGQRAEAMQQQEDFPKAERRLGRRPVKP